MEDNRSDDVITEELVREGHDSDVDTDEEIREESGDNDVREEEIREKNKCAEYTNMLVIQGVMHCFQP